MRADNTIPSKTYRNEQRGVIVEFTRYAEKPGFFITARYSRAFGGGHITQGSAATLNEAAAQAQSIISEHGVSVAASLTADLRDEDGALVSVRGEQVPVDTFDREPKSAEQVQREFARDAYAGSNDLGIVEETRI